jgi:hypothetical protein
VTSPKGALVGQQRLFSSVALSRASYFALKTVRGGRGAEGGRIGQSLRLLILPGRLWSTASRRQRPDLDQVVGEDAVPAQIRAPLMVVSSVRLIRLTRTAWVGVVPPASKRASASTSACGSAV